MKSRVFATANRGLRAAFPHLFIKIFSLPFRYQEWLLSIKSSG